MTKHILCAVDLTHDEDSRAMVREAGRLAGFENAALSVVTVLPDYGSSFVGSFFQPGTLKEATQAALKALHDLTDQELPGHGKIQCIVEIGTAYEQVIAAADKVDADMIIVGAQKPTFSDRVVGPNAARIVRHAKQSVLVVRH